MHTFTDQFISTDSNLEFLFSTMMGPNAMRIAEEMAAHLTIPQGACMLDLGCGRGLSTLLLVKEYAATVFAADLWIPPTENYERFCSLGIADRAVPLLADAANGLPFAYGYFDILFSVDAYHYFGGNTETLPLLAQYVKKGGYIAVAVPGWQRDMAGGMPAELQPFLSADDAETFKTLDWWQELWRRPEPPAR